MKVLYVVTGLSTGGAETALVGLLSQFTSPDAMVVSLMPIEGSEIAERIKALGIPVHSANLSPSRPNPLALLRLRRIVSGFKPDIVHGWMYHGCLLANVVAGKAPIVWGIRQSLYDLSAEKSVTRAVIKLCARMSLRPAFIIYNSEIAMRQHEAIGFSASNHALIPNGFDCERFRPNKDAAMRLRTELRIPPGAVLAGLIGRYHPVKDHANFLAAAGIVAKQRKDAHFILAGKDLAESNFEIMRLVAANGLVGRISLLGSRSDIPAVNAALDIACSSSWSEGFPNTIGEAMACGVPCVATDVGESKALIGATGLIVPPRNPESFAAALMQLIDAGADARYCMGKAARSRIENNFPLSLAAQRHESLYGFLVRPAAQSNDVAGGPCNGSAG